MGSRHLQALASIDRNISIEVVDPSIVSLNMAKERFEQVAGSGLVQSVKYMRTVDELSTNIDLIIVATSANIRRAVVEKVITDKQVRYMILEKVVFQNIQDFDDVEKLLLDKGIKVWVNCPRRMWPFYQDLKRKLQDANMIEYIVSGDSSQLCLGCNGIHFLDHYAYLTESAGLELFGDRLDSELIPSKRAGFIEFSGAIYGKSLNKGCITINAYKNGHAPIMIGIQSDKIRCIISEINNKAWISESNNEWQWREYTFETPYQSQLTHIAVQNILDHEECDLTSYCESRKLHEVFLKTLAKHLKEHGLGDGKQCPIT